MNDFAPLLRQLQRQGDPLALSASEAIRSLIRVRDELASAAHRAREQLTDVATGKVSHIYAGLCPDSTSGSRSRDPECPACRAIAAAESRQAGPVRLTEEDIKATLKIQAPNDLVLRISRAIETATLRKQGFNV